MFKSAHRGFRLFAFRNIPKPVLVLKLTAIFLTVAMLHVSAKSISQTVSFSGSDVPLEKVFDAVKTQTGFVFFYDVDILKKSGPVTLHVKNVPLEDFLRQAFANSPLKYSIQNNAIIVTLRDIDAEMPPGDISISGRIVDADGNPLSGATISMKTESGMLAIMSDADGKFSFSAKAGTAIEVSFVGYKTYTFKATQQTRNISISLSRSADKMNEVSVTTGFQTIAKERSTGAFSRVEGEEIQQKSVSINVIDRLEGLVPGLAVNNGQGADKFLIRGVNSVNANRAPLYVLDGVPIAYADVSTLVNPNDVESIQILRDAMATSIWGSQAANGVIVITSKKGKAQGHIKVQYNGFVSFKGLPDYSYQKMMSPKQFITAAQEVFDPSTFPYSTVTTISPNYELPVVFPHEQILYDLSNGIISQGVANQRLDSLASLNNRSQIEQNLMQPAMLTNHSVSFSGGSLFYSFYGSLNYTNTKNIDRSDINNYMVDFKQIFSFTPGIKLDITTNLSQQSTTLFIIPDLPVLNTYLPYAMFADAKGNALSQSYLQLYSGYQQSAEQQSGINLDYVPLK
ncbi:MAG TPA: TonB-dependent receptor plug domain-containing protein, partial [Puia sp.]|nr:TonB-dependent receptor plug domain-containing protein [Puia sp.]